MTIIYSTLENNVFSKILVKKGKNTINEEVYAELLKDKAFKGFLEKGFIKIEEQDEEITQTDFTKMTYDELKAYVKANNIEVKSMKKADILEALTAVSKEQDEEKEE